MRNREVWAEGMVGDGEEGMDGKVRSVEEMILPEVELGMAGDGEGWSG